MDNGSLLVIYDGECGFCRFGIELLRRFDGRGVFVFCPFGHPIAEEHLSQLAPEVRYESFHVVAGGVLRSGTRAAREALGALPFGRLGVLLGLHNMYPVLARYRWLLGRLTPQSGRLVTCG